MKREEGMYKAPQWRRPAVDRGRGHTYHRDERTETTTVQKSREIAFKNISNMRSLFADEWTAVS